jgi:membrane protein YqaA with SNARE-associated domain
MAGYAIGALLFEVVARPLLDLYGYWEAFGEFKGLYGEYGAWIVFGAGVTPFPYKVITIASGAVYLDLMVFVIASVLARGIRFFLVAGLLYYFGEPVRAFIERYLEWLAVAFFVLLVGGFVALKYLA